MTLADYLKKTFPPLRYSWEQLHELLSPQGHSSHIRRHRAELIISRVHLISLLFAVATPLWIVVDYFVFEFPLWAILAFLRVASGVAFGLLAWMGNGQKSMRWAYMMLWLMLAVPPVFYLVSRPFLLEVPTGGMAGVLAASYSLLPFVVVAGLSIFPLTAIEVVLFSLPVLAVSAIGVAQMPTVGIETVTNTIWLLGLVTGVAVFSGMSQLHYMIALINRAAHDLLTGAFTRRSGEETIDLQFRISSRTGTRLAIGFVDIDDFKSINDSYGHEEGDMALRTVAASLRRILRRSDTLVRWGGEEFVILLPNTDAAGLEVVLKRLREVGLGFRPDGRPITCSLGIAERIADGVDDWVHLIELADQRMYRAKHAGKNTCIAFGEQVVPLLKVPGQPGYPAN